MHTRLQVKAIEWNKRGRDDSFLLRKMDLADAETWFAGSKDKEPTPTALQQEYITTSRTVEDEYNQLLARGEQARQRVKVAAIVVPVAVVIAACAGVFATIATRDLQQKKQYLGDVWEFNQAMAFNANSEHERALKTLDAVLQRHPQNTFVLIGKGYVYETMQDDPKAEAVYRQLTHMDSNDLTVWLNLGDVLSRQYKADEAIVAYRKAIELAPKNAVAYDRLGGFLFQQNKADEAIAAYRKAIALDSKNARAYNGLGYALKAQGDLDKAIAAIAQAISLEPKNARWQDSMGEMWMVKGDQEQALKFYNQALSLDSNFAETYAKRGKTYDSLKRYVDASKDLDRAIELDYKEEWVLQLREQVRREMK
jgi:tetratricopeptide (TPR) repeat protein